VRKCNAIAAIIGVFLFLGGDGSLAIGAAVPFAEDFSGSAPDFTYSSSSEENVTAVVGSGVLTVDSALNTGAQAINVLVDISNANGIPIVMDTDITPTAWVATGGSTPGFLAFSTNPAEGAFPSGPNSGYLADITFPTTTNTGTIRLFDFAVGGNIVQSAQFAAGSLALDETYHLTFTATPGLGGVLDLSLTITDTTGTLIDDDGIVTISGSTPAVASTGTFFGYRHRVGNNGSSRTFDAVYDNFSIAEAPDPTLEGDYDGDGDVDAADYVLWRKDPTNPNFGGDPAGYNIWRANFGFEGGAGSMVGSNVSNIPEPGAIFLAVGAALGLLAAREKRFIGR